MALLLLALYYPYPADSAPARFLDGYLALQAAIVGACLRPFDASVSVSGTVIGGRFPLRIVLDCAALDAVALFVAAVLAFAAPPAKKAAGLLAGVTAIVAVNLLRMLFLYYAGVHWPAAFDFLHEDLMQLVLVLGAAACFAAFASWSRSPVPA